MIDLFYDSVVVACIHACLFLILQFSTKVAEQIFMKLGISLGMDGETHDILEAI